MASSTESSPPAPPTRSRRSSLTTRKSIVPESLLLQNKEVAFKQYITEAKEEKEEWVALAKARRAQAKLMEETLADVEENRPTLTYKDVEDYLTDEDKKFLSERPDYGKLVADMDTLTEEAAMVKDRLKTCGSLIALNSFLAEGRLDTIAQGVCSYNAVNPLWMPNSKP